MKLLSSEWRHNATLRCAGGCVVECRIYNREVAGSNLGLGYFAPRSTLPSILPGSVNEYQLRLGRQRHCMAHSDCGWTCGCAGKTVRSPENTRRIPERFCGGVSLRRGAISSVCTFTLPLTITLPGHEQCVHSYTRSSVTKQYNWYQPNCDDVGRSGEVTAGLALITCGSDGQLHD